MNRSMAITVDAAVLQTGCTFNLAEVTDLYIFNIAGIHDKGSSAYISHLRSHSVHIPHDDITKSCNHFRTMPI